MAGEPKTDEALCEALELRLNSRGLGAPATSGTAAGSSDDVDRERARLEVLFAEVRRHARIAGGVVAADEPARCRECGDPRFCRFIRHLADEFGVPITAP